MQHDFSCNRKALKNIRKLSDWFVKHRSFCADNMRKRLGAILEERFGEQYRKDRKAQAEANAKKLQPPTASGPGKKSARESQPRHKEPAGASKPANTATKNDKRNRKQQPPAKV